MPKPAPCADGRLSRDGFIRRGKIADGARFDGRMLLDVLTSDNTASDVWADTPYRSRSGKA